MLPLQNCHYHLKSRAREENPLEIVEVVILYQQLLRGTIKTKFGHFSCFPIDQQSQDERMEPIRKGGQV